MFVKTNTLAGFPSLKSNEINVRGMNISNEPKIGSFPPILRFQDKRPGFKRRQYHLRNNLRKLSKEKCFY